MGKSRHIMIVEARFYEDISDLLLAGAVAAIEAEGFSYETFTVPGALEIPTAIRFGHASGTFHGYVALGCVVRGETSHYDIVAGESARGLTNLALDCRLPIGNGILTCDTMEQAIERADPSQKNKGAAAFQAVFELLNIKQSLGI